MLTHFSIMRTYILIDTLTANEILPYNNAFESKEILLSYNTLALNEILPPIDTLEFIE